MKQNNSDSDHRFRDFFENINIGVAICDVSGNFLDINLAYCKLTGYSKKELNNLTFKDITYPDDLLIELPLLEEAIKQKTYSYNIEKRYIRKDKKIIWVDLSVSVVRDEKGKPLHLMGTANDITLWKQTEQELVREKEKAEEGQRKLKESHDIAKLGSWELDIQSGIFTFTDSFYKIFHTNAREMGGYKMSANEYASNFVYPDDASKVAIETQKAIETQDLDFSRYVEHRIIFKDGGVGYMGVWFFVVKDSSGKTIKTYGINQDISSRKVAEHELLKAKEKAEESDRLKTAFLQNMSHEIRTPLNAIMGFSSLIIENLNDKETLTDYERIITKSSNDLLQIVNDILDIAKIESSLLTIRNEQFTIENLINDSLKTYWQGSRIIDKENIHFKMNFKDLQHTVITADLGKLKQILNNLINNAYKFTDTGEIEVGCNLINNSTLSFYVKDTGIGIPEEKQELIFNRFYQVDSGTSRLYGGTGLGLSIVKGLLELLGGEIWIDSEPGKGSTFTFTMPVKITPGEEKSETSQGNLSKIESKDSFKISILIVEDDELSMKYFRTILPESNYTMYFTRYGREAIDIAIKCPIDIILMDIRLPDISGYEATRQIKTLKPGIYIIAQTAYASEDDRDKALSAGCDDFISKPVNAEVLISKLKDYLPH
jgi:PAS domain S-box-containing protein